MAYYGNSRDVISFFAANGLHCDLEYNPADFIRKNFKRQTFTHKNLIQSKGHFKECFLQIILRPHTVPP